MTHIEQVAAAMQAADERDRLVDWDCFADETVVDWQQTELDRLGYRLVRDV